MTDRAICPHAATNNTVHVDGLVRGVRRLLSGFAAVAEETEARLAAWRRARIRRRKLLDVLAYDNRRLDDMGLTRYAIEEAARLPLSVNAALVAREIAADDRCRLEGIRYGAGRGAARGPRRRDTS
jgi:uncharacterized protein YjiS (DUF1127 family)